MSLVLGTQPVLRFSKAGPVDIQGVSYEPKTIFFQKTITTAVSETNAVITLPAGSYITHALAICHTVADGNTRVSLGITTTSTSLIAFTNFSMATAGNYNTFTNGVYYHTAPTLMLTVGGTPVAGVARFAVEYYELGAMISQGLHFDL